MRRFSPMKSGFMRSHPPSTIRHDDSHSMVAQTAKHITAAAHPYEPVAHGHVGGSRKQPNAVPSE